MIDEGSGVSQERNAERRRSAGEWIERLGLIEHPEGGWYREVHRSADVESFPRFGERRANSTSIYFLVTPERPSRFHRLRQEEIWFFHDGADLTLHLLDEEEGYRTMQLGLSPDAAPQQVVPGNVWFAATVEKGYALVGCVVVPGFDFSDFELADRRELLDRFPDQTDLVERLSSPGT